MENLFHIYWMQVSLGIMTLSGALFLTLLCKGKRLFNNRYGNWIIALFLIMFFAKGNADIQDFKNSQTLGKDLQRKRDIAVVNFKMEENLFFDLRMTLHFIETMKGDIKANYSRSSLTGFSSGYDWEMQSVAVTMENDNKFSYDVSGSMHYYLFGIKVYSDSKYFTGTEEFEHQDITIHRNPQ